MDIKQIQKMPIGYKAGGITLTVKTVKKTWQLPGKNDNWIHQVLLADKSGDILADVNIGKKYNPLRRSQVITIIKFEVRETELRNSAVKIIYVDQFRQETITADEYMDNFTEEEEKWDKIARSKIKFGFAIRYAERGKTLVEILNYIEDPALDRVVEAVMKG